MPIDILNNNFAGNTTLTKILELSANRREFTQAINGTTASKYKDLAELQDSGNSFIYNQAKHDLVMKDVYEGGNIVIKVRLNTEEAAVNSIRDIIDTFNQDLDALRPNISNIVNKNQICDKALTAIGNVLNTRDTEGKYLFGGVNSSDRPCVDLTAFSNLDSAGNILNNYTTATPNLKTVTIGDGTSIKIGLDASNNAFATLIGAINKIKASPNPAPSQVESALLQTELGTTILGFENIEATILDNKKDLENAKINTDNKYIQATELLSSSQFALAPDEILQNLIEYARSQKILQAIIGLNNKSSDSLVDIL